LEKIKELMISIWEDLENKVNSEPELNRRIYRRLDLEKENGIRLGCINPGNIIEMLIEVGKAEGTFKISYPKWRGMNFKEVTLDAPVKETRHIGLILDKKEYRDIYFTVCSDLAEGLENCMTDESRRKEIVDFLTRWSRFFERYGEEILSPQAQRGLFGELKWLERMVREGIDASVCIDSWKGCEHGVHDFDVGGDAVELKTTMMKEPRKVDINNEKQLDERGFRSLHLVVISLSMTEGNGESLPDIVTKLRDHFADRSSLRYAFERSLRESGYLDIHAISYPQRYIVKKKELFRVEEGFPRIIHVPAGLGNIRYSLVLSACLDYSIDISEYFRIMKEDFGSAD